MTLGRAQRIEKFVVAMLVVFVLGSACSSGGKGNGGEKDVIAGASEQSTLEPAPKQVKPDGAIGDDLDAGNLSFRIFAVRSKDRIYAMAKPGAGPVSRGNISSEYVAIDYLVKNVSGSPITTGAEATLLDDQGNPHELDASITPPSGGTDGMGLGKGQTRASTMFFRVPNGIIPETLVIKTSKSKARVDLLARNMEQVPPQDYLRVYHLYLDEQAYEEAYEMFDPASMHDITLGEWLSFWEPLWGKRYVGLDNLRSLSETPSRAVFLMTRTIYDRDGDVMADPEIQPTVTQEMVKADGVWQLIMGDDLATNIIAVIGPDETPVPEPAAPESTQPPTTVSETTLPETTSPDSESTSSAPTD